MDLRILLTLLLPLIHSRILLLLLLLPLILILSSLIAPLILIPHSPLLRRPLLRRPLLRILQLRILLLEKLHQRLHLPLHLVALHLPLPLCHIRSRTMLQLDYGLQQVVQLSASNQFRWPSTSFSANGALVFMPGSPQVLQALEVHNVLAGHHIACVTDGVQANGTVSNNVGKINWDPASLGGRI